MTTQSKISTKQLTVAEPVAPAVPLASADEQVLERMADALDMTEAVLDEAGRLDAEMAAADAPAAFTERQPKTALAVSVVIPVYNERDTVRAIVERVRAVGVHQEIVIVDDFSIDGTRKVLLEMAADEDIRVLMHGYNRGKGAALRTAFDHVEGDVVIVQDADLEYDPADYPKLLGPIERGEADVVYGSRFLEHARQDPSRLHRFGNWMLTALSNLATGQRLTDMETCYKVFRREVLDGIDIEQDRFGFEPEFTAKLSRLGHRIQEVPIRYNSRSYDEGKKIGLRDGLNALWCIAKYR